MRGNAHTFELTSAALIEGQVPPLLSITEVADAIGLTPETIRRWCRAGDVPSIVVGRRRRIPATWMTALAAKAEAAA